ncbi:MAG: hypothetical protein K8S98_17255 [Planctomycetes bacterium]|nr:hypothetical protein [Planctomycetota bacterium]
MGRSLVFVALFVSACSRPAGDDPFTLARNLAACTTLEVSVVDGPAVEALATTIARLERDGRWKVERTEPLGAVANSDAPRMLIGDADTPGVAAALVEIERIGEATDSSRRLGPELADRARNESGFAFLATFADPARPGLPVTLALAHTAVDAAKLLGDLTPCAEPSWQLFADGELVERGLLWRSPSGSPPPSIDLASPRVAQTTGAVVVARPRFDVHRPVSLSTERLDRSIEAWERALTRLDATLLAEGESTRVHPTVFTHYTVDAMLTVAGAGELAVLNPIRPRLRALVTDGIPDDGGAALAQLVAREVLGASHAEWLTRAIGVEAAGTWYGKELERWLAHLARAGLVPTVAQLVDPATRVSPLVLEPARAGLVRVLYPRLGREGLRELWTGARTLAADATLESEFRAWLDKAVAANEAELADVRKKRTIVIQRRGFRRGVDMVAPQFDPRVNAVGFGSSAYVLSLGAAKNLGTDAVALVFSSFVDAGAPMQAGGALHDFAASASDLELFVGALRAKEFNLNVMVRPQLLATRTASLAGATLVLAPDGWDAYFAALERTTVHYALLAELAGAEIYCVAGEIASASVTKPTQWNTWERKDLPGRARRWEDLIAKARGAFTGALTFAAGSLYEAESIQFWGQMDFVGIDVMPDIVIDGLGPEFSRERAVRAMQGWLGNLAELASLHARPVLVTEIGFSSTRDAWKLAELPQGDYDGDMQARLVEAWGEALARTAKDRQPQGGAYLWCWSTDPKAGGPDDRGYSPQSKPAELALNRVFRRP